MKEEYRKALLEVYVILENTDDEVKNRIPKKFIDFIKNNMDINYKFKIEQGKELVEQDLMLETKQILALIYRDYICEENERKRLIEKESEKVVNEKRRTNEIENIEKYNISFESSKIHNENRESIEENFIINIEDNKWYKRLINRILKIFKLKK